MKKRKLIKQEINKTIKQEQRLLMKSNRDFLEETAKSLADNVNEKLPFDAKELFIEAFRKGFVSVFEKGGKYIDKTYNIEKMKTEYQKNVDRFNIDHTKKNLRAVEKSAKIKALFNTGISTIEGAAVGFMGLATAVADVPFFIAVVMKHLNETAMNYGFDYDLKEERLFMLNIITMSVSKEEQKHTYSKAADKIGYSIDTNQSIDQTLEEAIQNTSEVIAEYITTSKLLQSIPFAGSILGGVNNYKFMSHIGLVANIKYKKRYLYKMMVSE